jgi:hypothetical protein
MTRWVVGAFVIAHGLVTAMMWSTPAKEGEPFRATHSWLLGDARALAMTLAIAAAVGFVGAGVGILGHQPWWAGYGIAAGGLAVVLMVVYFNPWLLAGIAISATIGIAGLQALQQA